MYTESNRQGLQREIDTLLRPFHRYSSPAALSIHRKDMNPDIKRRRNLEGCTPTGASECADRISKLSDLTLVHILSFLNVKEAAQCDVLSSRWMGLWKHITRLDFDASKLLNQLEDTDARGDEKQRDLVFKYRTWVNQVLTLHDSPTVDEFRVQFDLDGSARNDIDQWIKFAISKRAKKLHIDFSSSFSRDKYVISPEFCRYLMSPTNLSDVKHLTSLFLDRVNLNGELVEYLLSNCPHLESLDISNSIHLVNLRIVGPSLRLKYLRLFVCTSLESIELCAPKLTTFCHFGKPTVFLIGNNPLLSELIIGGRYPSQLNDALDAFSHLLTQLETLKFSFAMKLEKLTFRVSEFTKLRQLALDVATVLGSIMPLADIIFAAPSLKKFTLQVLWRVPNFLFKHDEAAIERMVQRMAERGRICKPGTVQLFAARPVPVVGPRLEEGHRCLEEIEVFGYHECPYVMQVVDFLFVNTAPGRLKKVVIDPHLTLDKRLHPDACPRILGEETIRAARNSAYKLKDTLPPGVQLLVL